MVTDEDDQQQYLDPLEQLGEAIAGEFDGLPERKKRRAKEQHQRQEQRRMGDAQVAAPETTCQPDRQGQGDEGLSDLGRYLGHLGLKVGSQQPEEQCGGEPNQGLDRCCHGRNGQPDEQHALQERELGEQQAE